jgi:hypothetical protein
MTDRELNLKMAEVCGFPTDWSRGKYPCVLEDRGGGLVLVVAAQSQSAPWSPVENWDQVFEYVLPALEQAGVSWRIFAQRKKPTWVKIVQMVRQGEMLAYSDGRTEVLARCACEAAWDAWQKLEQS